MRFAAVAVAALLLAPGLHAGVIHEWKVGEIEDAPLLAVATVQSVTKREPVPPDRTRSRFPERFYEATLLVRRSFGRGVALDNPRIRVRYVGDGDLGPGGVNGYPIWPRLEPGQTALFALEPGDGGFWRLVADQGINLTVPAILPAWREAGTAPNGRAFIFHELANALAHGDSQNRHAAAVYLRGPSGWPEGFRNVAQRAIGDDDDLWLEAGCALLASLGIPHPTVAKMLAGPEAVSPADQGVAWALARGAKREYPGRLIRCLLRNMPVYDWGAANALLEFKDSPLVISGMTNALARDPAGSIVVAWTLVRNGQRALLPEALDAAEKLVSAPETVLMSRLQAASPLLRDYGSDAQFDVIPGALRRLQHTNEDAYRKLFQSVAHSQSPRELRVAAIAIDDRRAGFVTLRYCDVAAASVQRLSGQSFGIKSDMTPEERDRAVARAKAWLRTQRM